LVEGFASHSLSDLVTSENRIGNFERHFIWTPADSSIYVPDTNWSIGPTGNLRSWRLAYVLLVKPLFTWTTSDQNISWHSRLRMPNSKSNCH
jgi:hypothetical protein